MRNCFLVRDKRIVKCYRCVSYWDLVRNMCVWRRSFISGYREIIVSEGGENCGLRGFVL